MKKKESGKERESNSTNLVAIFEDFYDPKNNKNIERTVYLVCSLYYLCSKSLHFVILVKINI